MWGMFLPLGNKFSVDSILSKNSGDVAQKIYSWASIALVLQLVMIYVINGFGKTDPLWEKNFSALHFILRGNVARPAAGLLLEHPQIVTALTWLTIYLERFATFLLFFRT